jgi:hypothetical protein
MTSFRISTETWPIVVHTMEGSPTDAEIDAYIAEANTILLRKQKHSVVMDSRKAGMVSSYARKRTKEWLAEHFDAVHTYCAGTAYVFSSPALRFVLSGVMLLQQHPNPYVICGTLDEGFDWARKQLAGF